jgi:hypothetical protein
LIDEGFVRKVEPSGNYALTLRIVSLGLHHLAGSTIAELAVPVLARLANESQQLVRLGLVDGELLLWVARTQGERGCQRNEPDVDHGKEIPLAWSASEPAAHRGPNERVGGTVEGCSQWSCRVLPVPSPSDINSRRLNHDEAVTA